MGIFDGPKKERDCPLCGTETEVVDNRITSTSSAKFRKCQNPDCDWLVMKGGRWSSPRRQEDFPEGSIGWEMHAEDA